MCGCREEVVSIVLIFGTTGRVSDGAYSWVLAAYITWDWWDILRILLSTRNQQGKKLGLRIIEALDYIAERIGCYKVCLLLQNMTQVISCSQWPLRESQVDYLLVVYC